MSESELNQVENHMSLVHGIIIQLAQVASTAEQLVLVVDLKKVKTKLFSNKILNTTIRKAIPLCLKYFPELLYKAFIVNAPMSFSGFWDSISSLLPPETKSKVRVLGGSSNEELASLVTPP
eukprot:TRINITY_DN1187_c0_g1_i12.p2 TRINITY_DN1187_c0_g1~~TRINITY_DN1187_c0_g1_i12.p2  ORF type:complete len:121 (+),score=26.27 TRINITY_DN1187_c0_g1_i12:449-811(+)